MKELIVPKQQISIVADATYNELIALSEFYCWLKTRVCSVGSVEKHKTACTVNGCAVGGFVTCGRR